MKKILSFKENRIKFIQEVHKALKAGQHRGDIAPDLSASKKLADALWEGKYIEVNLNEEQLQALKEIRGMDLWDVIQEAEL